MEYIASNDYRNYLEHYGVLGMKWGVRKNPEKAYKLAEAKRKKLDTKKTTADIKYKAKQYKANKLMLSKPGSKKWIKAQKKANKLLKKSTRYEKKYQRWEKAMTKTFQESPISLSELMAKHDTESAKNYVNMVIYANDGKSKSTAKKKVE